MGDFVMDNVYLYKKNASFNDVNSLIEELAKLKKDYSNFIKTDIKENLAKDASSILVFEGINGLVDKIIKDSRSYERGHLYDYSLDLSIYFGQDKLVVGAFGGIRGLRFFRENFKHPTYEYYAYVEEDEELPEDWDERGEFWDKIFEKTGVPSNVSLLYDLYSTDELGSICWDLHKDLVEKSTDI